MTNPSVQLSGIDPICGMKGRIAAHGEWFCSVYCVRKFESEKRLAPLPESAFPAQIHENSPLTPLLKNKLFLVIFAVSLLLLLSLFVAEMAPFRHGFLHYIRMIALPLALGFLIGGLIEVYVPRSAIIALLAGDSPVTILKVAVLGILFSGCSHGCLAIAIALYHKGASGPCVLSFLIASPWMNAAVTILLLTMLGTKGAIIILAAFCISLCLGWLTLFLQSKNLLERNPNTVSIEENFSVLADLRKRWQNYDFSFKKLIRVDFPEIFYSAGHLAQMVLFWVLVGTTLASLIGAYVPPSFFRDWMDKSLSGMGVTLAFATALEVCSEGSAPLAFEIYRQTGALGNTFVFLLGGLVTDYTEIGLLWTNIGKKTALWFLTIGIVLTLLAGAILNFAF